MARYFFFIDNFMEWSPSWKLLVSQLVKKCPALHRRHTFITAVQKSHCSIHIPCHKTPVPAQHTVFLRPTVVLFSHQRLSLPSSRFIFRIPHQNFVSSSVLYCKSLTPRKSHPSSFYQRISFSENYKSCSFSYEIFSSLLFPLHFKVQYFARNFISDAFSIFSYLSARYQVAQQANCSCACLKLSAAR